jgi:hypothetical protein
LEEKTYLISADRGLAHPYQLRRMLRAQGRNL